MLNLSSILTETYYYNKLRILYNCKALKHRIPALELHKEAYEC